MKNKFWLLMLVSFLVCGMTPQASAQIFKKKKNAKKESAEKKKDPKSKIKPYKEIVTKDAITDDGLITVHKVKDKHYFELSNDVLDREILIVSRISGFVKGLNFGGAGVKSRPQQVIKWQKMDDKILLRSVSYNSVASEEDPIYRSVRNNNFEPIVMSFDVVAYKDSTASVIDIGPLFTTDVTMIGAISSFQRKNFGIKGLDAKRSLINNVKSYPQNIEVRHILTYRGDKLPDNQVTGTMSVEMNQSMILLPEETMAPRKFDPRVGFFSISQTDYSLDEQKAASRRFITRWKLVPKDVEAYKRGELVEPVKPIIYYIDPATPAKWKPYIMQGVDDWREAFEGAGFKNAIMAKEPPTPEEDPEWSPEDVRYSVIRYVTTEIQNAMGPHVHDPRTGEILESDIIWYHNVMNLLRNWFFIQTAAINPDARKVKFDDEVMGRLIRFVSAHEVGHTLGLPHNMGSSVAYHVDSLRSPSFTRKFGTAPSIMDYARFNYVAQPEDGDVALMPNIGPYDKWSIVYGYKLNLDAQTVEEDHKILNNWIKEKNGDPNYRFGRQRGLPVDPSAQTEDLGHNSMLASDYGIKNLKRIMPNLINWTEAEGEQFNNLNELYGQVFGQFRRYMGHVTANVGGVFEFYKSFDENEPVYSHADKERQAHAVRFLNEQLFQTPVWLVDKDILGRIQEVGVMDRIRTLQGRTLNILFNPDRLKRMIENEALNGSDAYAMTALFEDSSDGIFSELSSGNTIDTYRRNLHRAYVDVLENLMKNENDNYDQTDIKAVSRATLSQIRNMARSANGRFTDKLSKYHAQDLVERITMILDPKR